MSLTRRAFLQSTALSAAAALTARAAERPPNIVFILADDLGYGDLGAYGQQKIRTPRLDRLAREGLRGTQHYCGNAVCAPSRCVLLTGRHPGHAFIRDNREVKPEGQLPLPAGTATLASLLKARGYATGAFGKWGLGGPGSSGDPLKMGFDRFYGYNCQRVAHNYYPTYLWDNDRRVPLRNAEFSAHQKLPVGTDANDPASYRGFTGVDYAPDLSNAQAREFIRAHRDQPFFCYVPTTVPHLALQVPEDSLAEYRGAFPETPYTGDRGYLPHRTPRAAYAAMITRMDTEVGRLLDLLDELQLRDNTLVIFTSDNGPLYDELGGTDTEFFNSHAGLRGRKGSVFEGGIRAPLLVRWPGHVRAGSDCARVTGFEDWLPTLLDAAGARDSVPAATDGVSFLPTLLGRPQAPRPFIYREFAGYGGQQWLRVGDHVALRQGLRPAARAAAAPSTAVQLYDLAHDPHQTRDLAAEQPTRVAELAALMRAQHTASAEFPLPALDRPV